jgi:tRNA-dihydrouridine synthase B
MRIHTALEHLKDSIEVKGERRAILEFRKYYSSYLKGLYGVSAVRQELMRITEYSAVEERLRRYLEELDSMPVETSFEDINRTDPLITALE